MEKNVLLLDGNSLINRAYYAIQRPMMTKEGVYTQGIFGFLNMLSKLESDYEPGYLAVCFDRKAPTFRHEEYAEYKAGRRKMPPELAMQIPILKDILRAMNVAVVEGDGWEADDYLGTLSLRAEEAGLRPYVVTGDKDSLQLASDKTTVIYTKRGVSEFDLYDTAAMKERYGLTPTQFIDLKGLMGDSSDNIPGIPGVGEKTALPLLQKYGSVEEVIAHAEEIPQKGLRQKIIDNATSALMSKRLATIVRNIPGDWNFETMRFREPNRDELIELYKKLEFNIFLKRLLKQDGAFSDNPFAEEPEAKRSGGKRAGGAASAAPAAASAAAPAVLPDRPPRTLVFTAETGTAPVRAAVRAAAERGMPVFLSVRTDGNHIDVPSCDAVGLLCGDVFYWVTEDFDEVLRMLIETDVPIAGHRLKDAYYVFFARFGGLFPDSVSAGNALLSARGSAARDYDMETAALVRDWVPNTSFDSEIAAYLLNPNAGKYELETLYFAEFHRPVGPAAPEEPAQTDLFGLLGSAASEGPAGETSSGRAARKAAAEAALAETEAAEALRDLYGPRLEAEGLTHVLRDCELPLVEAMATMEANGFRVDPETLKRAGADLTGRIAEHRAKIFELAGEEFNIASPKQLGTVLFEKLMLPAGKKTKTGYSTNAEVLEGLRSQHPIVSEILEYRTLTKLKSTYIEGMLPLIAADGRIHAHFQQTAASTGRISCTEPNLQNIPVRYEEGRKLRKAFVPNGPDELLVGADYSQIELRVLACLSGDESLLAAFRNGEDIHRATAANVLGKAPADVTDGERSAAKAINFGLIYGKTGFGLSNDLHISVKAAEEYIDRYFAKYPTVRAYLDGLKAAARETGYAATMLGRKRPIPEIVASQYTVRQLGERLAMNSPIQGTAADIIKLAMIAVNRALKEGRFRSRLILQVHDELILSCAPEEAESVKALLIEKMEGAVSLAIPMKAELETATNWYDL